MKKAGITAAALAALAGAAGMFAPPPQGAVGSEPKVSSTTTPTAKTPALPGQGGFFQQMSRAFLAGARGARSGVGSYRKWPRGSHKQKRRIAMRRQRGGLAVELIAVMAGVAVFIALCMAALIPVAAAACHSRWADSGLQTRYGALSGCLVQMPDGRWLPDDRVREVAP